MLCFNYSGLNRFYWLPEFHRRFEPHGLWFVEMKWLGVQVSLYSVEVGREIVKAMNRGPVPAPGVDA